MTEVGSGSFAEFYAVHFSRIAEELRDHLGDHAEAVAVTQEAFCRALLRWRRVSREHQPEAWVRDTAWKLANSRLRYLWAEMPRVSASEPCPPAIQPPGVPAVETVVRRRRVARRTLAATALVAVLALPFPIGVTKPAEPAAPVLPTSLPSPSVQTRRVDVPGLKLDVAPQIYFVDASHGWAWYDTCPPYGSPDDVKQGCHFGLGATTNGGRSWRKVTLPGLEPGWADPAEAPSVNFIPHGPGLASLHIGDEVLITADGGGSFAAYPPDKPPTEVLLAQLGRYQMLCLDNAVCDRTHLVKVGVGRMSPQPPLRGPSAYLINGADGRLWLSDYNPGSGEARLMVSTDEAKSWRELPFPDAAVDQRPKVSPDGTEIWLKGQDSLLRLDRDRWVAHGHSGVHDFAEWEPVGGGAVAVATKAGGFGFVQGGLFRQVSGVAADYLVMLPDGTLSLYGHMGLILGVGTATDRSWIQVL